MMLFKLILFSQFFTLGVSSNENDIRLFFNNVLQYVEQLHGEATDYFVHGRLYGELCDHIHISVFEDILKIPVYTNNRVNFGHYYRGMRCSNPYFPIYNQPKFCL